MTLTDNMMETILEKASNKQEDMIIMGDFNLDPNRESARQQLCGYFGRKAPSTPRRLKWQTS